jgi:2'-hydroxyisoflavone reductase
MLSILVLGGTRFVGLAIINEILKLGADITIFNRGMTHHEKISQASYVVGDRGFGYESLGDKHFDFVIDISGLKRRYVEHTKKLRFNHYIFISSVAVYDNDNESGIDEGGKLIKPRGLKNQLVPNGYALNKLLSERYLTEIVRNLTILRPGFILGPNDYTERFSKYCQFANANDPITAPLPKDAPFQFIDVRDFARFVLHCVTDQITGTFNVVAPPTTWLNSMQTLKDILGRDLKFFEPTTPEEFPLCDFGTNYAQRKVSAQAAINKGLETRKMSETYLDFVNWLEK